eukprot:SAG11_NODE_21111_length_432_cov_0.615616_2_plen_21_part_01
MKLLFSTNRCYRWSRSTYLDA